MQRIGGRIKTLRWEELDVLDVQKEPIEAEAEGARERMVKDLMERRAGPALKGLTNQGREFGFYSGCSRTSSEDSNGVWWYDLSFKKSTLVMCGKWIAW